MTLPLARIGAAPPPSFDEPLEMLGACHERIEAQLATLERLARHLAGAGCDEPAREAARAVMRYFDTAGRNHHRDEDDDLFPLLRALAAKHGRHEVGATLHVLEREHKDMDLLYSKLRAALDALAQGRPGGLDAALVEQFAALYRSHMGREGAAVLPFAREALDANQRRQLGERMAERRRIPAQPTGRAEQE